MERNRLTFTGLVYKVQTQAMLLERLATVVSACLPVCSRSQGHNFYQLLAKPGTDFCSLKRQKLRTSSLGAKNPISGTAIFTRAGKWPQKLKSPKFRYVVFYFLVKFYTDFIQILFNFIF